MLGETKWSRWWDSLPESYKKYIKNQPIWYDTDLYKAIALGIVIGFIVGFLFGYEAGVPETTIQKITYLKG